MQVCILSNEDKALRVSSEAEDEDADVSPATEVIFAHNNASFLRSAHVLPGLLETCSNLVKLVRGSRVSHCDRQPF